MGLKSKSPSIFLLWSRFQNSHLKQKNLQVVTFACEILDCLSHIKRQKMRRTRTESFALYLWIVALHRRYPLPTFFSHSCKLDSGFAVLVLPIIISYSDMKMLKPTKADKHPKAYSTKHISPNRTYSSSDFKNSRIQIPNFPAESCHMQCNKQFLRTLCKLSGHGTGIW